MKIGLNRFAAVALAAQLASPAGMLDATDMSAWTVTPALRSGTAKFKVTDNGDGTKTISVRIPSVGLVMIYR